MGFLRVLDAHTLGFADYGGNRQLLTAGHLRRDPRVALFLMDDPARRRLKIDGEAELEERVRPLRQRIAQLEAERQQWSAPSGDGAPPGGS